MKHWNSKLYTPNKIQIDEWFTLLIYTKYQYLQCSGQDLPSFWTDVIWHQINVTYWCTLLESEARLIQYNSITTWGSWVNVNLYVFNNYYTSISFAICLAPSSVMLLNLRSKLVTYRLFCSVLYKTSISWSTKRLSVSSWLFPARYRCMFSLNSLFIIYKLNFVSTIGSWFMQLTDNIVQA